MATETVPTPEQPVASLPPLQPIGSLAPLPAPTSQPQVPPVEQAPVGQEITAPLEATAPLSGPAPVLEEVQQSFQGMTVSVPQMPPLQQPSLPVLGTQLPTQVQPVQTFQQPVAPIQPATQTFQQVQPPIQTLQPVAQVQTLQPAQQFPSQPVAQTPVQAEPEVPEGHLLYTLTVHTGKGTQSMRQPIPQEVFAGLAHGYSLISDKGENFTFSDGTNVWPVLAMAQSDTVYTVDSREAATKRYLLPRSDGKFLQFDTPLFGQGLITVHTWFGIPFPYDLIKFEDRTTGKISVFTHS